MAAYGDVKLKFMSYYKYSFNFEGFAEDGAKVSISIGGDPDDIYRYSLDDNTIETLNGNNWSWAAVVDKDNNKLWDQTPYG